MFYSALGSIMPNYKNMDQIVTECNQQNMPSTLGSFVKKATFIGAVAGGVAGGVLTFGNPLVIAGGAAAGTALGAGAGVFFHGLSVEETMANRKNCIKNAQKNEMKKGMPGP
jgi:hypothetical protein